MQKKKKTIFEKFSDEHSWWSVIFSFVVASAIFSLFLTVPELKACLFSAGNLSNETIELHYVCFGWLLGWWFMYYFGFVVSLFTCIFDLFKKDPPAEKQ